MTIGDILVGLTVLAWAGMVVYLIATEMHERELEEQ